MSGNKFLRQVAAYFCRRATADNMAELVMVVPNRRSGLFLKKHFQRELADRGYPVMMPRFHTIGRLVQDLAQVQSMPRNEQLFLLYEAYCEVLAESGSDIQAREFDRFAFWGDIILNDFDNIDSSLADASAVFRNLKGLKEIAADFLTDEQKDIVRRLWGDTLYTQNSNDSFWLHFGSDTDSSVIRNRFIQLWELLGPLYLRFHKKLNDLKLCTDGLQQRLAVDVVRNSREINRHYAFVGFSTVSNAEFALMDELRKQGMAEFFWDFKMLPKSIHLSSSLAKFYRLEMALPAPEDFKIIPAEWPEKIECVAVPSNNGQAKYLSGALRNWYKNDEPDENQLLDTAIIVPDESLLQTIVLSLPPCIDAVNITLRLPYRSTTFASLLSAIIAMQMRARMIHGEYHFFYEDVERLLAHPHLRTVTSVKSGDVLAEISARKMYNIPASELRDMLPEFSELFNVVKDLTSLADIHRFTTEVLDCLDKAFSNISQNSRLIEFRMLSYFREQLNELYRLTVKYGVTMNESTYFSLFERLLSAKRIDLHGSPLKGLQIMGVLETRALDFNRVIIMSMNERIFPKRNYLRTMIPDSLRRAYCLGTESEAEAAYSYYFYRTVTGAKEVKLLYDNRSASLGAGETSRFISQLRHLHSEQNIIYSSINLSSDSYNNREIIIEKDNTILELLNEFKAGGRLNLSASALKTYLSCPLKFYLLYVRRLSEAIEVTPYLRASDYGTVVHSVMEYLYKPYEGMYVTANDINSILNRNGFVTDAVQAVMSDYLNQDRKKKNLPPRKLNTESLILCRVIEHFVRNVLVNELDAYCRPKFRYICAERQIVSPPAWAINPDLSINFKMFIDRIDEIHPGCLRFIDYKTGTDAVSAPNIPAIFKDYSYGAIFQLLLYCEAYAAMVDATADIQPVVYNFTTITASQKLEPVRIGKTELLNYKVVSAEFMPLLRNMIQEIFNPDIPFCQCRQNSFSSTCTHCPFTDLCGR